MEDNVERFIEHVKAECKKHKIKLQLRKVKYLKLYGNIKCSGYFDEEVGVLAIAIGREGWLGVLVHEYGHLTQWVEQCKAWTDGAGTANIDHWLSGKRVRNIKVALAKTRDLELDNEKRSVKLIKKWELPIDIKVYIQKANAYVQFYNYIYYTRRWATPTNSPYRNPAIYGKMPTTFRMNYKTLSKIHMKVFEDSGI